MRFWPIGAPAIYVRAEDRGNDGWVGLDGGQEVRGFWGKGGIEDELWYGG